MTNAKGKLIGRPTTAIEDVSSSGSIRLRTIKGQ